MHCGDASGRRRGSRIARAFAGRHRRRALRRSARLARSSRYTQLLEQPSNHFLTRKSRALSMRVDDEAVPEDERRDGLDGIRRHELAAFEEGVRLGSAHEGQAAARARSDAHVGQSSRRRGDRYDVLLDLRAHAHFEHLSLKLAQLVQLEDGLEAIDRVFSDLRRENPALLPRDSGTRVRVASRSGRSGPREAGRSLPARWGSASR